MSQATEISTIEGEFVLPTFAGHIEGELIGNIFTEPMDATREAFSHHHGEDSYPSCDIVTTRAIRAIESISNSNGCSVNLIDRYDHFNSQPPAQPEIISRLGPTILERERQRLSRDIHDVSGQYIVAILFRLATLERGTTDQGLLVHVAEIRATLIRLTKELEGIAAGERPGVPPGPILVAALSNLIAQWEDQIGIPARFLHQETDRLDIGDAAAEAVFRIVQEALTNIAKHAASASSVTVQLEGTPASILLTIEDDGTQVVPSQAGTSHSRRRAGVAGMSARIAELGGSFSIQKRAAGGTRLEATIPLGSSSGWRSGDEAA